MFFLGGFFFFSHNICEAPLSGRKLGSILSLLVSAAPPPDAFSVFWFEVILPRRP